MHEEACTLISLQDEVRTLSRSGQRYEIMMKLRLTRKSEQVEEISLLPQVLQNKRDMALGPAQQRALVQATNPTHTQAASQVSAAEALQLT